MGRPLAVQFFTKYLIVGPDWVDSGPQRARPFPLAAGGPSWWDSNPAVHACSCPWVLPSRYTRYSTRTDCIPRLFIHSRARVRRTIRTDYGRIPTSCTYETSCSTATKSGQRCL